MADKIRVVPIAPIDAWDMIHMTELYKGPYEIVDPNNPNLERKVPRVGWWVCEEAGFYRVNRVHADNTSDLARIYPGQGDDHANIITGPAVHQYTTPFRLMVDPSTTPVRFRVDDAMWFNGSEPVYYKVFKGSDITSNGQIVSTAVNGNGQPTNANLMLELIQGTNTQNNLVKVARGGHLLEVLAHQEMVTVVAYRADGLQVDYRPAVVCHTNNMAPLDLAKRVIVKVALETPFLNPDDKMLIDVPVNMLIDSTGIMGVVTYNDGTVKRLPINGEKFALSGLSNFVSATAGSMFDLGLSYYLADDEVAWDALGNIDKRTKTEEYKVRAINPDGNYTAKLFVVPFWNNARAEYQLQWYLYNMERKYLYDVTTKVELTPGFTFNGKLYATKQSLRVAVDMGAVDTYFINYRHVQNVELTLMAPGATPTQPTYYRIEYDDQYTYGNGIRADVTVSTTVLNNVNIDISNACTTVEEWLNKIYYPTGPLFYTTAEDLPPNPTEFVIRNASNTWRRVIDIEDVLKPIMDVNQTVNQGDTLILEFGARTATDLLQLSMASMIANRYQNP